MSDAVTAAAISSTVTGFVALVTFGGIVWKSRVDRRRDRAELEDARQRAIIELAAERERIQSVDAPASNAEAWSSVFKVTHDTMLSLKGDISRLEQRLNDQEHEHRVELEERDRRERDRELALQHTADSLRRCRSYISVVTQLLADKDIPFPAPPEDVAGDAPERRKLTAPATVTSVVEGRKP